MQRQLETAELPAPRADAAEHEVIWAKVHKNGSKQPIARDGCVAHDGWRGCQSSFAHGDRAETHWLSVQ